MEEFIDRSLSMLLHVPAGSPHERGAWICRNLAEFALVLEILGVDVAVLDSAVLQTKDAICGTDHRFVKRLRDLRQRRGRIPTFYPIGRSTIVGNYTLARSIDSAARTMASFADLLRASSSKVNESALVSDHGASAISSRDAWRPTFHGQAVSYAFRVDLPSCLVWRGWFSTMNGVCMVCMPEQWEHRQWDIRWGVHNGTHLDLLSLDNQVGPSKFEYGDGLLLSEAVAMSSELLAGAEGLAAGEASVCLTVAEAIEERLARLPLSRHSCCGGSYARAAARHCKEFNSLPTLSSSYVAGALNLIGQCHRHSLLPAWISDRFEQRWHRAADAHPAIASFIQAVRH